jgi:hypothetical protein
VGSGAHIVHAYATLGIKEEKRGKRGGETVGPSCGRRRRQYLAPQKAGGLARDGSANAPRPPSLSHSGHPLCP